MAQSGVAATLATTPAPSVPTPIFASINDLPDDCLIAIFSVNPVWYHWERLVLNLSHVCRRWRHVMLSTPSLWSTVPRINNRWTELCLERSKNVLLDIRVDSQEWILRIPAIYSLLLRMERTRSLYLWLEDLCYDVGPPEGLWGIEAARQKILEELVVREAPNLEKLHMGFDGYWGMDCYFSEPTLPDGLFGGKPMPRLNDLNLEFCIIPSPTFIRLLSAAAALTHLYLRGVRAWDNVDDMVRCLNAAPRLRSLHWEDRGPDELKNFAAKRSHVYAPRCVRLDEMVELKLGGSHTHNMVIFSYLSIPGTTRLAMDRSDNMSYTEITDEEVDDLTALFAEALCNHFAIASANDAFFESIWFNDDGEVESGMGEPSCSFTIQSPFSDLLPDKLALHLPWGKRECLGVPYRNIFMETWLSVPVFNRALSIPYDPSLPHATLSRFSQAREVRIRGSFRLQKFCTEVLSARPCPLPALERVRLEEVNLSNFGGYLLDALRAGAPVRELVIVQCELEEATFEALETLLGAGAVEWDRKDNTDGARSNQ